MRHPVTGIVVATLIVSVLQKSLKREWEEAERVREESAEFLTGHGFSGDLSFALSMVASELVENAVKYGDYHQRERDISMAIEVGTIEVRNPIDQSSAHFQRRDHILQSIRGFQNPFEAYVERLKAVSESSLGDGESGLGPVRVAYEAQTILYFYIDESDTLTLSAVYQRCGPAPVLWTVMGFHT